MKAVHIEFIENRHWRAVWVVAFMVLVGVSVGTYVQWRQFRNAELGVLDQMARLERPRQQASIQPNQEQGLRQASAWQAARLLQFDLNKVFANVENLQLPGVNVRGLSMDASNDFLRLEIEVDGIVRAPTVTDALNAGYDQAPWRLEQLTRLNEDNRTAVPVASAAYHGIWIARPANL